MKKNIKRSHDLASDEVFFGLQVFWRNAAENPMKIKTDYHAIWL